MSLPRAAVHEVADWEEWSELALVNRWTDGLPVYPPTVEAVERILDHLGRKPDEDLGVVPPAGRMATFEVVAANCVMAGCRPEHVPLVCTALQAMLEPRFNLQGVQTTTHPCEPLTIVSGPVVEDLGFWTGEAAFAGGAHANVAVGRAIRLLLWNVGGGYPGEPCRKILGQPGRFSFLIAENSSTPWGTLAAARGVNGSALTLFACEPPHSVLATLGSDMTPETILPKVASIMSALGNNNIYTQGEQLVVFSPFLASDFAERGWSRGRVQERLFELARKPLGEVRPRSAQRPDNSPAWFWDWLPDSVDQSRDDAAVTAVDRPEDIHIVVSGARGGRFLAVCPGWGHFGGFAVTRPVNSFAKEVSR
jgi:hypothetical protein